jgi:hypothetical protein
MRCKFIEFILQILGNCSRVALVEQFPRLGSRNSICRNASFLAILRQRSLQVVLKSLIRVGFTTNRNEVNTHVWFDLTYRRLDTLRALP